MGYSPSYSHLLGTHTCLSQTQIHTDLWDRELAFQIADQFAVLGGTLGIRTAVVVGGMDMMTQAIELCRRPHVVIATPGRMVDHLNSSSGEWDLSRVKFLVRRPPSLGILLQLTQILCRYWTKPTVYFSRHSHLSSRCS